ncbi:uracil-DNA glycosylase [Candidatus Dependentiae bacterium]|nr:uracil-DNA glycosylase [Candidatus Dependentiae bacterium]
MTQKEQKQKLLEKLYVPYKKHKDCPLGPLCKSTAVFGEGNANAKLMFIGEAPGAKEEELGRPFVGRSGKLLDKILAAYDTNREDVYITNIVKCRPPKNRTPTKKEINACKDLLHNQIKIIKPKVMCTLGASALEGLTGKPVKITKVRGIPTKHKDVILLPAYHPAYILRNPKQLEFLMADIREAIELSKKQQLKHN